MIYYGNPAGYLSDGKVVLDSIFNKKELTSYIQEKEQLEVEVRAGVYDRLSEGGGVEKSERISEERRLRIYQLNRSCPFMMRFISLAEREKRGFGKPHRDEYTSVYEGEVESFSLEEVWERFGRRTPLDFEGHALSISDIIEFSDDKSSRFFYVEPNGFEEIKFET